jgi:trigger factor
LREQYAQLQTVDREIKDGDHVTIDIEGSLDGEPVPGLTTSDYLFEVGKGTVVREIDENLRGKRAGDHIEFEAVHPDPDEDAMLSFVVDVKEVKEKVLPPVDDDFARNASEFETAAELRADIAETLVRQKRAFAQVALRTRATVELVKLVEDEPPAAMIDAEARSRLDDIINRLRQQGIGLEQYLQVVGKTSDQLVEDAREGAGDAVKADLALRAVAAVKQRFTDSGQMSAIRSSIQKQKALDWLIERAEIVDPDGTVIDRAALEAPDEPSDDRTNDEQADDQPATEDLS